MAKKQAAHQEKRKKGQDELTKSRPDENKYDYLLKKDWDELVIIDDEKLEASDFVVNRP